MSLRVGGVRARFALFLFLIIACLLSACGRKAKPEPRWGKSAPSRISFHTR